MKHWKTILGIFIGLTIFGLFLPFLITQNTLKYNFGVSNANEIGDTIGGILGPYFSFIGSVLLAYTIYLQIEQRKDDEIKYSSEKLRLESEIKIANQKEFEKMIFESCMELLNNVEKKIHEINFITPDMVEGSVLTYLNPKYEADNLNRQEMGKQVNNEIINSMSLFNENKINEKAYQRIFINKIDNILLIIDHYELLNCNKKNRTNDLSPFFFKYESINTYEYVHNIYFELYHLKSNYQKKYDEKFQKDEIEQLKETLAWLGSFEDDLRNYFKLKGELPFAPDFGHGPILNDDIRESYEIIKAQIAMIEKKYGLNN